MTTSYYIHRPHHSGRPNMSVKRHFNAPCCEEINSSAPSRKGPAPPGRPSGDLWCHQRWPKKQQKQTWLVVYLPLWKILVNGKDYPIYYDILWKINNVPNHQPETKWSSTAGKCSSINGGLLSLLLEKYGKSHGTKSAELQVGFSKRWMFYDDIDAAHFNIWVCLKIVYPYTQWLMIIIPTKWL